MQPGIVILDTPVDGKQRAGFRELNGADELALFGCDYPAALGWVAARMVEQPGFVGAAHYRQLGIADGDRLFAALYAAFFGDAIELRQACPACPESFELSLTLSALLQPIGTYPASEILPGGTALRAPLLGDLEACAAGEDLLIRLTEQAGTDTAAEIDAAVTRLARALIETIETHCPHCKAEAAIAFDLPRYFLRCAERERDILLREVHLLARTYSWGLSEILSLRRADRHALVRMATAALAPRNRMQLA